MGTGNRMRKFAIILIALCLMGCKAKEKFVTVEVTKSDTIYINKVEKDSVYLHDSIYTEVYTKGDTVFATKYKEKTKYIDRLLLDSVYVSKVDTIVRNDTIVRVVVEQEPFAKKARGLVIAFLVGMVAGVIAYLILKLKKA